jgi:hypothetical protein
MKQTIKGTQCYIQHKSAIIIIMPILLYLYSIDYFFIFAAIAELK